MAPTLARVSEDASPGLVAVTDDSHEGSLDITRRLWASMCPDTRSSCACRGLLLRAIQVGTVRSRRLALLRQGVRGWIHNGGQAP